MHVIFSVPMLGIRQHYGMSVGEFTTKHLRLGNYIFDIGGKSRRFIPQAMCLLEEYSDEEWIKMEKAQADEEAAKKKSAEEKKVVDDAAKERHAKDALAKQAEADRLAARPWWKKLLAGYGIISDGKRG